tara:strand:- start:223 stop:453 length:231 start_codon:yes stop_codon:yes gene_type:complete
MGKILNTHSLLGRLLAYPVLLNYTVFFLDIVIREDPSHDIIWLSTTWSYSLGRRENIREHLGYQAEGSYASSSFSD